MPERKESVDSFDDFFGVAKTNGDRKKSPVKPKENQSAIAAMVRTQPIVKRPETPPTPEEQRTPSPEVKPKVDTMKTSVKTNGYQSKSPAMPKRPESSKSKVYESDFDDDNNYEDEETMVESPYERKEHSSLPPPKQRTFDAPRRGSDSELKKSFVVAPQKKAKTNNAQRKEPLLPVIRPQQPRRALQPPRSRRDNASASTKNEVEQRLLSAHNSKLKNLESRLAELRHQLDAQRVENATLRTIQKREEKAIRTYEEKEYDIHRIVQYYTKEADHIKRVLSAERQTKARLEKQIEARDEKLQDQTKRLKQYEKVVHEKHLDERYELREKLNETDKRLQEFQEKLNQQQKYIDNLEKNHRHEVTQELNKQRDLKRELDTRSKKYTDLLAKFEEKTRQMDTMHIYAQRGGVRPSDSPSTLPKSRSLQSLHDPSPRGREKTVDLDKKKREQQQEQDRKPKARQQQPPPAPPSNDSSPKSEKKKVVAKKEPPQITAPAKTASTSEKPSSTTHNGHLPPKGKPTARRLSTPKSVDEDNSDADDDTFFGSSPKKLHPPAPVQRGEQHLSNKDSQKRPVAPTPPENTSKYKSTGAGGATSTAPSSTSKPVEPAAPPKPRPTRDLDEKWSDMFGTHKQDNSAKEDLLAKLVADEQQERKMANSSRPPPAQSSSTNKFDSSTRSSTTTSHPTTNAKPVADPFESLFVNNSSKPAASRRSDPDDIFSTKPTSQPVRQPKTDSFDSLFGPSSTAHNSSTSNSNSKQSSSQNDKLQRPKAVTNPTRSIPNRTVIDEVEEFVL